MKNLVFIAILFQALALLMACKHTQYTADHLPNTSLRWGKGGGIVGKESGYVLLENGQIFFSDGLQSTLSARKNIKARRADRLVDKAELAGLDTLQFKHPGNVYMYLELSDDGKTNRVVWGDGNHKVPVKIEALFQELTQIGAFK
ncbi:MAG: hypothetical protein KGS48_16330 [Bacteroidetes bacterium]|nr:hypothetical protein [Bacteroidota bacterium]